MKYGNFAAGHSGPCGCGVRPHRIGTPCNYGGKESPFLDSFASGTEKRTRTRRKRRKRLPRRRGTHLEAVVSPRSEFHRAFLIVEREPGDVDLAGALEDPGRDVEARPVALHHHVRRVRSVEALVRTAHARRDANGSHRTPGREFAARERFSPVVHEDVWFPEAVRRDAKVVHSAEFRCVPSEVIVVPFLAGGTVKPSQYPSSRIAFIAFDAVTFTFDRSRPLHFLSLLRYDRETSRYSPKFQNAIVSRRM